MFRHAKPSTQPRSLRSRAERMNAPANFSDSTYDAQGGVPSTERTAGQRYRDPVTDAQPTPPQGK